MSRTVWYSPTTWVEKVTKVGPTNLNKVETGISDAHTRIDALTYNVKDYGAKGDGVTDDTTALQAAITACISAGGGIVSMPQGTYVYSTTLDFSALAGTLTQVTFAGAGSGGIITSATTAPRAATRLKFTGTGHAIKAVATNTGSAISGLVFRDFALYCTANIGSSSWGIYWDGVYSEAAIRSVIIVGSGTANAACGNGLLVTNCFNGQTTLENVIVSYFNSSTSVGCRISAEATTPFPSSVNSGNLLATNVLVLNSPKAFQVYGSAGLLNSVTLVNPKAVSDGTVDGIALQIGTNTSLTQNVTVIGLHSEGFSTGIWFDAAFFSTVISPFFSWVAAAPTNSASLLFDNTSYANTVIGAQFPALQYGALLHSGCNGNQVSGKASALGGPTVAVYSDLGNNLLWNMANGAPVFNAVSWPQPPTVTAPTLAANWSNHSERNAGYWIDGYGVVHLEGCVQAAAGALGTIFTLPSGFRPSATERFTPVQFTSTVFTLQELRVLSTGDVLIDNGVSTAAGNFLSFAGITFRAA